MFRVKGVEVVVLLVMISYNLVEIINVSEKPASLICRELIA
jgi:hypothetical protein